MDQNCEHLSPALTSRPGNGRKSSESLVPMSVSYGGLVPCFSGVTTHTTTFWAHITPFSFAGGRALVRYRYFDVPMSPFLLFYFFYFFSLSLVSDSQLAPKSVDMGPFIGLVHFAVGQAFALKAISNESPPTSNHVLAEPGNFDARNKSLSRHENGSSCISVYQGISGWTALVKIILQSKPRVCSSIYVSVGVCLIIYIRSTYQEQ